MMNSGTLPTPSPIHIFELIFIPSGAIIDVLFNSLIESFESSVVYRVLAETLKIKTAKLKNIKNKF
jgi:hypothetical protein